MTARCIAKTGDGLPANYLPHGYTPQAVFDLSLDRAYRILGIGLWQCGLLYLISDDNNMPNWYPNELFAPSCARIPDYWHFAIFRGDDQQLQAIWGYEQLVCQEQHNDELMGREPRALRVFHDEAKRPE